MKKIRTAQKPENKNQVKVFSADFNVISYHRTTSPTSIETTQYNKKIKTIDLLKFVELTVFKA